MKSGRGESSTGGGGSHDSGRRGVTSSLRRLAGVIGGFALIATLSGCLLDADKPDIAIDVPQSYKETKGPPEAALPALDWWHCFRSGELVRRAFRTAFGLRS
jgi:hypothetical protein